MPSDHSDTFKDPIQSYLDGLFAEIHQMKDGTVADYIPELSKADPDALAIVLATTDGKVYAVGDAAEEFTIQSVSKPFMYAHALSEIGTEAVLKRVGVAPTGDSFNSIVLDQEHNRPFNPMVNAGAIAVSGLVGGDTQTERLARMRAVFDGFAGRPLQVDEDVFRSERDTGHRNRAITYLMLNSGMIDLPPDEQLEIYFRQCSVSVTCTDLAMMAATLANLGVHPVTGDRVVEADHVRETLSVMMSCGMYDYAGEWSFEVGLPAKSGVSGGILAVLPGQLGIAVWSPRLDSIGNSVRGVEACRRISSDFGVHIFGRTIDASNVIRSLLRGPAAASRRARPERDIEILDKHRDRIVVIELQGALFFGSAERIVRKVRAETPDTDAIVVDFRRVSLLDTAALRLIEALLEALAEQPITLYFAGLVDPSGKPKGPARRLATLAERFQCRLFPTPDGALESIEDEILKSGRAGFDPGAYGLDKIALFDGLSPAQLGELEILIDSFTFEPGQAIIRRGDDARLLFIIVRGSVSVMVPRKSGEALRVTGLGPGQVFGEMAVIDRRKRSADVVANTEVLCYALAVEDLTEIAATDPNLRSTILRNLAREFSVRLRQTTDLLISLQ